VFRDTAADADAMVEEYIRMEKSGERGYGSRILQEIAQIYDAARLAPEKDRTAE
jgi:hypothetical protein